MDAPSTILITGGTGLIGSAICDLLLEKEHKVIILTRDKHASNNRKPALEYAEWDIDNQLIEPSAIQRADHIIHLAGSNVGEKRWTVKRKREIFDSRVKGGELLVKALREIPNNVKTVITASAIGWYGEDGERNSPFSEEESSATGFLGETCKAWEESIEPVKQLGKRLVKLRTGLVLSKTGGMMEEFKKPLRVGVATILGSGKQMMSWIHLSDLCRLYCYMIEHPHLEGVFNAVGPKPESNRTFVLELAKRIRGSFYIPVYVPAFALKLTLGEMSIEVLKSTTVSNQKVRQAGFRYVYPSLQSALDQLTSP